MCLKTLWYYKTVRSLSSMTSSQRKFRSCQSILISGFPLISAGRGGGGPLTGWTTAEAQVLSYLSSNSHFFLHLFPSRLVKSLRVTPENERVKRRDRRSVGLTGCFFSFFCLLQALLVRVHRFRWQRCMLVAIWEITEGGREGVIRMFFGGHDGMAWCLEPVNTQRSTSWRATISQSEGLRPDAPPQSGSSSWCRAGRDRKWS